MTTRISFFVGALTLVLFACNKGKSLEQLQQDGYACSKAGSGAGFVPKPGSHCFMCPDSDSMSKCGTDPLTSGCKEVDLQECK